MLYLWAAPGRGRQRCVPLLVGESVTPLTLLLLDPRALQILLVAYRPLGSFFLFFLQALQRSIRLQSAFRVLCKAAIRAQGAVQSSDGAVRDRARSSVRRRSATHIPSRSPRGRPHQVRSYSRVKGNSAAIGFRGTVLMTA